MKMARRKRVPTREEIRNAVPSRNPAVEESGGLLSVPLAERKGLMGWVARKASAPNKVEIELDEIGAFVWGQIDGRKSVAGISQALAKQYKLNKHESEASLLEFIDRLRQRGCVTLTKK